MKLEIELVPASSWYDNVRSAVSSQEWDVIRYEAYAKYNNQCGICGSQSKRLEAHEIWTYDDDKQTQTLEGIIALCSLCHRVKHIGLTELLASQGKLNLDSVVKHFCRVNDCDYEVYIDHRNEAFAIWDHRSSLPWAVDISWLETRKKENDQQGSRTGKRVIPKRRNA